MSLYLVLIIRVFYAVNLGIGIWISSSMGVWVCIGVCGCMGWGMEYEGDLNWCRRLCTFLRDSDLV